MIRTSLRAVATVYMLLGLQNPGAIGQSMIHLEGQQDGVNCVAFSPSGRFLASGAGKFVGLLQESRPGTVVVWLEVRENGQRVALDRHKDGISSVVFSPNGAILATASYDGTVKLWDVSSWRETVTMVHHGGAIWSAAFSPDGRILATGGWGGNSKESVHEAKLWDVSTHSLVATLGGHKDGILSVAFSPDGKTLATGSMDGTVKTWDVAGRTPRSSLTVANKGWVSSIAFSPDGGILAAGSRRSHANGPGKINLWRTGTWNSLATLEAHGRSVLCVAFLPDGTTLASGGEDDGLIALWSVRRLKKMRMLQTRSASIATVAFSPDGNRLASGDVDGIVQVWTLRKGEEWSGER